jgi:hypothetical protein
MEKDIKDFLNEKKEINLYDLNTITGYKVMRLKNSKICSLADDTYQFNPAKNKKIQMEGQGVWLSTNKQFVLDYYSNADENNEVLVTLEFNPKDITAGNLNDREPVITVPKCTIKSVHHIIDQEVDKEIKYSTKKIKP